MKVGDLVRQSTWDGIGIITKILPYNGFYVWFPDGERHPAGEYRLDGDILEVVNESR